MNVSREIRRKAYWRHEMPFEGGVTPIEFYDLPKPQTMKKYKVITDNLDWYNIKKGDTVDVMNDVSFTLSLTDINRKLITTNVVELHPDWFETLTESPKEYTKEDVIEFAWKAIDYTKPHVTSDGVGVNGDLDKLFNKWLKTRKV